MNADSTLHQVASNASFGLEVQESRLWFALMHLCFYERQGSRTSFYGIVERAFEAVGMTLNAQQRTQLGRNIFSKFLVFGILSKSSGQLSEEWSCGINRLLITAAGLVPIGDSDFTRFVCAEISQGVVSKHLVAPLPRSLSIHDLWTPVLTADPRKVMERIRDTDCEVRRVDVERLIGAFPRYEQAFSQLTNPIPLSEVVAAIDAAEVSIYDFAKGDWRDFSSTVEVGALYKVRYEYGVPRWLLTCERGAFEILEGDWAIAIARSELSLPITINFDSAKCEASLSKLYLDSLPNLVRMVLVGRSYQWPQISGSEYRFKSIHSALLTGLTSKLPALEVINEQR